MRFWRLKCVADRTHARDVCPVSGKGEDAVLCGAVSQSKGRTTGFVRSGKYEIHDA